MKKLYRIFCLTGLFFILNSCTTLFFRPPFLKTNCPTGMSLVYSLENEVNVCVDIYEYGNRGDPYPLAHQNFFNCKRLCNKRGKRLLNHTEWVTACQRTPRRYCNIYQKHPIIMKRTRKARWIYNKKNCKKGRNAWSYTCMNDPSLNSRGLAKHKEFPRCRSKYGIRHMIGNLGEWVSNDYKHRRKQIGWFNGGLYSQKKSSCRYLTVAHGPRYYDYSIGCRCGKDPT